MPGTEELDEEVYPNPPLQLVAFEMRYPFSPKLNSPDSLAVVHEAISELFPLVEPATEQTLTMAIGGAEAALPVPTLRTLYRLLTPSKTMLATVSGSNAVLETSEYSHYGEFRGTIERVLAALAETGQPFAIDRIGLRYVDEIRVPGLEDEGVVDWTPYLHSRLLAADRVAELVPQDLVARSWQGVVEFGHEPGMSLVMRYGSLSGAAVSDEGPLALARQLNPGAFFLLDIDSFWARVEDEVVEFVVDSVLSICDRLHAPIRELFEGVITERYRDEVLRKEVVSNGHA